MSDIFISYARPDRAMAESLANELKALGYRVWWDAELVGSDDFYEVILQALNNAKAAIVIWTKASAKSKFVRDEARFALHLNRLVATKEPSLDTFEIPFGFQGQHTDDVTNREHILRAIHKLGVKPAATHAVPGMADWEKLKSSAGIDELVAYIGSSPPEPQRKSAVERLTQLSSGPEGGVGNSASVHSIATSNWQALLSGLTFRLPRFQLSAQGTWTSIGVATFYSIAVLLALWSSIPLTQWLGLSDREIATWGTPAYLALMWLAWGVFSRFVKDRNFPGAYLLAALFWFLFSFLPLIGVSVAQEVAGWNLEHRLFGPKINFIILWVVVAVLTPLTLIIWRIRAAR